MDLKFDYEARYREFSGKTKPCVVVTISFQGNSYPHPMLVDSGADCTIY